MTQQESKQLGDQERQKVQQDNLLQSMQDNIRELEQVTEGLQAELQHKETVFDMLKKDNEMLDSRLRDQSLHNEKVVAEQKFQEEELQFLKKQHALEQAMLKEQYEKTLLCLRQ